MAIYTKEFGNISYDSEELIAECKEDIEEFGNAVPCYVICKRIEKYGVSVIVSYMVGELPDDTQEEREEIAKFKASLQDNETITTIRISDLLVALEMQNSIT